MPVRELMLGFMIIFLRASLQAFPRVAARAPVKLLSATLFIGMAAMSLKPCYAVDQLTLSPAAKRQLKKLDEPIVLRGDFFKAVQAAYDDFAKDLATKETSSSPQDPESIELVRWLSKIENYDIDVEQSSSSYVVLFGVTLRDNAPLVFGGGARYVIDKQTFQIVEKKKFK
jgi:hypothetical protein